MGHDLDLCLFGATGFTGRLVAEYLSKHAGAIRWAVAGRNPDKLESVAAELGLGADVQRIVCDVDDPASLEAMVRRTRVVCTTVGPYARYGHGLASACAEHGTHYCDLTGEVQFIRASIDRNHARARASGARIVHSAGFDSIPSDLGVLVLAEHAQSRHQETLARVRFVLAAARGGFSGGTVASLMNVIEEASHDPSIRRLLGDPYALSPDRPNDLGLDGGDRLGIAWDPDFGGWVGPFLMAPINTRVVRRSNALAGFRYGRSFRYEEVMGFPGGRLGLPAAAAFASGYAAMLGAMLAPPTRRLLARALPAPGEGPDAEARERGFFHVRLFGVTTGGRAVEAEVRGVRDPGYGETAKMLAETALALVHETFASPEGGVLTPAFALGLPLVERLRAAGMTFEARDRPSG